EILEGRLEGEREECEVVRLSELMRGEGVERVGLLKIDVQRAEKEVLEGIDEEDWGKIEQVGMEVHDRGGGESEGRVEEIGEELRGRGFRVVAEQEEKMEGTDRWNVYATRRGEEERGEEERKEEVGRRREGRWEVSGKAMREYVRRRLPEYMVPA